MITIALFSFTALFSLTRSVFAHGHFHVFDMGPARARRSRRGMIMPLSQHNVFCAAPIECFLEITLLRLEPWAGLQKARQSGAK